MSDQDTAPPLPPPPSAVVVEGPTTIINRLLDFAFGGSRQSVFQMVTVLRWSVVFVLIAGAVIIFYEHLSRGSAAGGGWTALLRETMEKIAVRSEVGAPSYM
jgi:hypothetical protein